MLSVRRVEESAIDHMHNDDTHASGVRRPRRQASHEMAIILHSMPASCCIKLHVFRHEDASLFDRYCPSHTIPAFKRVVIMILRCKNTSTASHLYASA
jgi:hypothetical protein